MSLPNSSSVNPAPQVRKPRANVYTVMLILAFVFILIGCILLWAEIYPYHEGKHLWGPAVGLPRLTETLWRV